MKTPDKDNTDNLKILIDQLSAITQWISENSDIRKIIDDSPKANRTSEFTVLGAGRDGEPTERLIREPPRDPHTRPVVEVGRSDRLLRPDPPVATRPVMNLA